MVRADISRMEITWNKVGWKLRGIRWEMNKDYAR